MKRQLRVCLAVLLAVLMLVSPRISQAVDENTLTKGASDFLIDRANDNYLYIFERRLAANSIFKNYFPETLRVAKAGDFRSLLTNRGLWEQAVNKDLEAFLEFNPVRADVRALVARLCKQASESTVSPEGSLKILCEAQAVLIKDEETRGKEEEARKNKKELPKDQKEILEKAVEQAKTLKDHPVLAIKLLSADPIKEPVDVRIYRFDSDKAKVAAQILAELVDEFKKVNIDACKGLGTSSPKPNNKPPATYTMCVVEAVTVLNAIARADYAISCTLSGLSCDKNRVVRKEDDSFDDFRRYALFFAQMGDAKDPDTVKALLKAVTVPPVSFGIKREPHRTRVLITSYLGGAWATPGRRNHQTVALSAPIGVEISQAGSAGNSVSLLLSPIDLGYPVSLRLNGVDTPVRASDVLVPAAYVLYGWRNYPFTAGFGYSRVKNVENPDRREGRLMILIAFDMPLFKLR